MIDEKQSSHTMPHGDICLRLRPAFRAANNSTAGKGVEPMPMQVPNRSAFTENYIQCMLDNNCVYVLTAELCKYGEYTKQAGLSYTTSLTHYVECRTYSRVHTGLVTREKGRGISGWSMLSMVWYVLDWTFTQNAPEDCDVVEYSTPLYILEFQIKNDGIIPT